MKGFFTAGGAVLLRAPVSPEVVEKALAPLGPVQARVDDDPDRHWAFGRDPVVWQLGEGAGRLVADVVDRIWPDDMGSSEEVFSAWSMGWFADAWPGALGRAVDQRWHWPEAEAVVAQHTAFVRLLVTWVAGEDDPVVPEDWEPLRDLDALLRAARALLDLPEALAWFASGGEMLLDRDRLQRALQDADDGGRPPIDAWSNVRYLRPEPGWSMMDTVGSGQSMLPDLEALWPDAASIPPDDVAMFLRNLQLYLLGAGDVVEQGHSVDGPGGPWQATRYPEGLIPAPRPVVRLVPDGTLVPEVLVPDPPEQADQADEE